MHFAKPLAAVSLIALLFTTQAHDSSARLLQDGASLQPGTEPQGDFIALSVERVRKAMVAAQERDRREVESKLAAQAQAQQELEKAISRRAQTQQDAETLSRMEAELNQQATSQVSTANHERFMAYVQEVGRKRQAAGALIEVMGGQENRAREAFTKAQQETLETVMTAGAKYGVRNKRVQEINELLKQYGDKSNQEGLRDVTRRLQLSLYQAAVEEDVKSRVHLKVSRGPGATVKYQLENSSDVQTAKCAPECDENMYIGVYYIWAERNNAPTSAKNKYTIQEEKEAVTINENH